MGMNYRRETRRCSGIVGAILATAPLVCAAADDSLSESANFKAYSGNTATMLGPALLEASGAVIGAVTINNRNIFDLENPKENKSLFRLANRIHITTRPNVIEQQLLFKPGETFSAQALEESERIIRAKRYIHEVSIQPVRHENGVVDVNVETTDTWTLMPRLSLSRSGGENKYALGLKEQNLLGSGTAIQLMFKSDVDRDSRILKYNDQNLGNSWYGLSLDYQDNSDGHVRYFALGKPFYSLDSRNAQGLSFLSRDSTGTFYDRGEIVSEYQEEETAFELHRGWSKGLQNGWTRRYSAGLSYQDHRFSALPDSEYPLSIMPQDRELLTPFFAVEIVEDHFEKSKNHDQINTVEDRFLGTRFSARLGVAREDAGSDRDAWLVHIGAQTGIGDSSSNSLLLASALGGRLESGGVRGATLDLNARYYRHQSDRRRLYMGLAATYGKNLDLDEYLVLGGETGLRGYPLRFQSGDKRVLFTIEQRYFTNRYLFRLFHVGGAVFFDMGRAWGDSPVGVADNPWLKDIGVGLRFESGRSGLGRMIHVDLAVPLDDKDSIDGVQILVSTKKGF
jgi:outer membrane protein assembly factor BamA